jgi:hypothetical protein
MNCYGAYEAATAKLSLLFGAGFLAMQLPAFFLVRAVPIIRVMPYLAILQGIGPSYHPSSQSLTKLSGIVSSMPALVVCHTMSPEPWIVSVGVAAGLTLPVLVVYTWSWVSPRGLPLALLAWTITITQSSVLFSALSRTRVGRVTNLFVIPWIFFYLGLGRSDLLGAPMEVSWLDSHRKILVAFRSAMGKFDPRGSSNWRSGSRVSFCRSYPGAKVYEMLTGVQLWPLCTSTMPLLYLGISWLHGAASQLGQDHEDTVLGKVAMILISSGISLVLLWCPRGTSKFFIAGLTK